MLQVRRELPSIRYTHHYSLLRPTSKSVDGPLLKLLEGDIRSGRICVKVETMRVVEIFVCRRSELFLAMVDDISPLGVNSVKVLPQHDFFVSGISVSKEWKLDEEWNWLAKGMRRETRLYASGVAGWARQLKACGPIRSA